jgi:hypothetical protein
MTVNIDIPLLRRRAQFEMHKVGEAADKLGAAAQHGAEDASNRLSALRLPSVDLGGAVKGARQTVDQAVRALSEGGEAVAKGAEEASTRATHLGRDIGAAVEDLRHLRVTRERPRRDPWPGVALVMGIAGGIAAMFFFDPRDGKRRRTLVADKLGKWGRVAGREARGRAVDLRNRSQGVIHEARSAITGISGAGEGEQAGGEAPAGSGAERQPVGVSVGEASPAPAGSGGAATAGVFTDWSHEAGTPNGRETSS